MSTEIPTDKKYVQDADPNTGISWDGKSAIVYRYADGSQTTEKRNGGYYEIRPNVWVLYTEPIVNIESDGTCDFCGRGQGLLSAGKNRISIEIRASETEFDLITTDRESLEKRIKK